MGSLATQASRIEMATAGQDASASLTAAAAPGPAASVSRTTAMPSSPRSNVAGAIRWQYAEPTHRSGSTVILTSPPSTAECHGSPVQGDRKGLPSVQLHVLVAPRLTREPDGAVAGGQFPEQCLGFHPRQAGPQAEVGSEAERRVTVAAGPGRVEAVRAGE